MAKKKKRANGEGSVYKRANGTWVAQMTIRATGKRRCFYGRTQAEVLAKLRAAQADETKGTLIEPSKITVKEWLALWLDTYKKPNLKQTTWDSYEMLVRRHIVPTLGNTLLQQLQPHALQQLYTDKLKEGCSPRTVAIIHTILHAALGQAMQNQLVQRNVAEATVPPRQTHKEKRALTPEETTQLLQAAQGNRLYAAVYLGLTTGLRRGELLALHWEDIDFDQGLLQVKRNLVTIRNQPKPKTRNVEQTPKTKGSVRVIPLAPEILTVLQKHKEAQEFEKAFFGDAYRDQGLVFATIVGTHISPRNFSKEFAEIAKAAGLEGVSPHTLRHTFASRLGEMGTHPRVVQKLLGHATVDISLEVYTHVAPDFERAAIEDLALQYGCSTEHKESPPE